MHTGITKIALAQTRVTVPWLRAHLPYITDLTQTGDHTFRGTLTNGVDAPQRVAVTVSDVGAFRAWLAQNGR